MPLVSLPDREQSAQIRFVSHPLFSAADALEKIERLNPRDREENPLEPPSTGLMPGSTAIGKLCEQPILSREEERYLFLRMNYEKFAATQTAGTKREHHLSQATAFRNRLVMANFRLLVSLASQFATPAVRTEDLVSEGVVPLLKAVELFDVSRGWAFGTYATHVLRNHFRRTAQRQQRKNRLAARLSETQLAEVPDEGIPPVKQAELATRHNGLARQCLAELPPTDQIILRTRFGFDDPASPKLRSYAEVGEVVGLSKERVRVRTHRALELLRETAQQRHWEFPELETLNLRA